MTDIWGRKKKQKRELQSELDKWILRDTTVKSVRREMKSDHYPDTRVAHMIAHVGVAKKGD